VKKILSLILACCLVFSCGGGGGEPFLAVSVTYDEADTEAHAMELTSLYPPPCISLTEILLAAGLTGAVLLIGFLFIKLRREKKENATLLNKIGDADIRYGSRYAREIFLLNQDHRLEIEALQVQLNNMRQLLNGRPVFASIPTFYKEPIDPQDFDDVHDPSPESLRKPYDPDYDVSFV
jgi:hypothetical protein